MNIKMIVTDLDNTLLRRDKTISQYTESIFNLCHNKGIVIVFATARPVRAVEKWLNIGIKKAACIYHNGAVVKIGDTLFQETAITHDTVTRLLGMSKQFHNMKIAVEINDMLYANFDAKTVWPSAEYITTDFCGLPKLPCEKLLFVTADKTEIKEIERLLDDTLYWEISENEVLMVMNKNARKCNAVANLASHFGISMSEIVAFGDDNNDVEMLRDCGIGVAVANAIDEAKMVADYICGDCDEDGIAKWLEENLVST